MVQPRRTWYIFARVLFLLFGAVAAGGGEIWDAILD